MAFTQKLVRLTVTLAANTQTNQPNTFAGTTSTTATIAGHRTRVRIQNLGAASSAMAQVDVWGLSQSLLNQLSTLGMDVTLAKRNTMQIDVGDNTAPLATVYKGTIFSAYASYESAPDVPMHFALQYGLFDFAASSKVTSYTGATSAVTVAQDLATKLGLTLENNGVTATVAKPPYLDGSAIDQLNQFRDQFPVDAQVINGQTLAIFPKNGFRSTGAATPVVVGPPPIGQMISYPSFTQQGIIVQTQFDPAIQFFGQIDLQGSIIPQANKIWRVVRLDHDFDSAVPGGHFRSILWCYSPNSPNPIVVPAS